MSVLSFALIFWLTYSEISYYFHSKFTYTFAPDMDFDAKLKLNVDLTVAMPCQSKFHVVARALYILRVFR